MLTAFLIGWFGLPHCYGMCGSIVGALSMSLAPHIRNQRGQLTKFVVIYGLGRITTYTFVGAISGLTGQIFASALRPLLIGKILRILSGILLMIIGAYLAGWLPKLARLERIGDPLWQQLAPLARKLLPVRSYWQAWMFGVLWGFLPCGLVYSMLVVAALTGTVVDGAAYMLAFGLGTLPGLWLGGILANWLIRFNRTTWLKAAAGLVLIFSGLITIWTNSISQSHEYVSASHQPPRTLYGIH